MRNEQLQPPPDMRSVAKYLQDQDGPSELEQREAIQTYMDKYVVQLGLFGEALNEHAFSARIAKAFYSGDTAELGRLMDIALREYIYPIAIGEK